MLALVEQRQGNVAGALEAARRSLQPGVSALRSSVSILTWVFRETRGVDTQRAAEAARGLLTAARYQPSMVPVGVRRAAALYVLRERGDAASNSPEAVHDSEVQGCLEALEGEEVSRQRAAVVRRLLETKRVLLADLVIGEGPFESTHRPLLRRLASNLEAEGYLERALSRFSQAQQVEATVTDERKIAALRAEIEVLAGRWEPEGPPRERLIKKAGRVLHVVGKSLPDTQSGYTLRTAYTVNAQRAVGLDPVVVTQPGVGDASSESQTISGVRHYRLAGLEGPSTRIQQVQAHVDGLAAVVREAKPALLHAHSDFYNALAAVAVGRAFDIPVVYETRGFWEETWLSRHGEHRADSDVYRWRRERERACRDAVDHVITLAQSMKDHIIAEGLPPEQVSIVPNAAELREETENAATPRANDFEIESGTVVVGYISSLVPYEGVDVLVDAVLKLRRDGVGVRGLVVGDGPELQRLKNLVAVSEDDDAVIFTGKVPHDQIGQMYGLIDIFVIPRKPFRVCHLVSPLKPYEALLSGTAVVASDVAAMADIARESGSLELFKAGDADSLADVLLRLVENPEHRRALALAGRAWVQRERSWRQNGERYWDIYTSQGLLALDDLAMAGHVSMPLSDARAALAGSNRQMEDLASVDRRGKSAVASADKIMTAGWERPPYGTLLLSPDVDWRQTCPEDRSWAFRMHSWDWLAPVLIAWEQTRDLVYLDWAVAMVRSWYRVYSHVDKSNGMAWYDMAVGLRGHRLGYLVVQAAKRQSVPDGALEDLLACVRSHQRAFADPGIFARHSNHGFYVAAGQAAFSRHLEGLPGMVQQRQQAEVRLAEMLKSQFAADGAHKEHSPDYHRMVLGTLRSLVDSGLVENREILELIHRADELLGWFIQPDGTLVQLGDSHQREMSASAKSAISESSKWALSAGREGAAPKQTMLLAREGGYALARVPTAPTEEGFSEGTYFAMQAGFHSRVHKHADDLAIVWWDKGHEVCVDPGSFGYVDPLPADSPLRRDGFFYSAPERRYVESTRAHCTVEIDGRDHKRRERKPYGSAALQGAIGPEGRHRVEARVIHDDVVHSRTCEFQPGSWLLVWDVLTSQSEQVRQYRQCFTLAEQWEVSVDGGRYVAKTGSTGLFVTGFADGEIESVVRGQRAPEMRGWRSRQAKDFRPAPSLSFIGDGQSVTFITLLSFGEAPTAWKQTLDDVRFSLGGNQVTVQREIAYGSENDAAWQVQ